jgi:hypothetical protein
VSRIVIVARTRMHGGRVCIGGHDLTDRFRGVRLLDWYGDSWPIDSPFMVGELWDITYKPKISARPPHVEDVIVSEYQPFGQVEDLKALVLQHRRPWSGAPEVLFDGTVRRTDSGATYIPIKGRLPQCSTGYWQPDQPLPRRAYGERVRFEYPGESATNRMPWVGIQKPPGQIAAGSLIRVSLSRAFKSETVPEGYYLQISGVL